MEIAEKAEEEPDFSLAEDMATEEAPFIPVDEDVAAQLAKEDTYHEEAEMLEATSYMKDGCTMCSVKRTNIRKGRMDWDYFKYTDGTWCRLSASAANSVRKPCYVEAGTVGKSWRQYTASDKHKYLNCLAKATHLTKEVDASCPAFKDCQTPKSGCYANGCEACTSMNTLKRKSRMDWDYFKYTDGSWCRLTTKAANTVRESCYKVAGTVGVAWRAYNAVQKDKYLNCLADTHKLTGAVFQECPAYKGCVKTSICPKNVEPSVAPDACTCTPFEAKDKSFCATKIGNKLPCGIEKHYMTCLWNCPNI